MAFVPIILLNQQLLPWMYDDMICNKRNMYFVSRLEQSLRVDHNTLLQKLCYYGVRATPLNLFASYLDNTVQCTKT